MVISGLLYTILAAGICMVNGYYIQAMRSYINGRVMLRRNIPQDLRSLESGRYEGIERNIYRLLVSTGTNKIFIAPREFIISSGMVGLAMSVPASISGSWNVIGVTAGFGFILPYTLLRLRLHDLRFKLSAEGIYLVRELLNSYRVKGFNIEEALDELALHYKGKKEMKPMLLNLAKNMKGAVLEQDIRRQLDYFKYSISTTWSDILTSNIFFAKYYGTNISEGMEDLLGALYKAEKAFQYSKRHYNDSRMTIFYLMPIMYIITVLGAIGYFKFTLSRFIWYQFFTPGGVQWFIWMVISYTASIVTYKFISGSRMDV